MGTVAHDYNLNIWGSEIGKWEVQGHPQPYSKFEAKMSFMRSHFKKKSKQTKVVEEKRRGREQKERNPWLTRSQDLYFKRAWRWMLYREDIKNLDRPSQMSSFKSYSLCPIISTCVCASENLSILNVTLYHQLLIQKPQCYIKVWLNKFVMFFSC